MGSDTAPAARGEKPSGESVPSEPHTDVDLGARIVTGTSWKLVSQVVGMVTRAIVTIILAHLLTPFEFGIVGLALVFATLFLVFGDVGLGPALVQRRTLTEEDRSTVFWTSLGVGVLLSAVGVAAAPLVADFFDQPDVEPIFAVFSVSFLLTALTSTQSALLTRAMNFRVLEVAQMAATVVGGGTAVAVALLGGGAWAIVSQSIVATAVFSVLLWLASTWRPHLLFSRRSLHDLYGFSLATLGASFLKYLERNVDNLLIGRFLGATPLGIYSLSYNLMLYPLTRVADPIRQVMFPAFSRMQTEPLRIFALWLRGTRLLAALIAPTMFGLIVVAPDFVPVVLGEKWEEAVPVIRVLAWVGLVLVLESLNASILLARGRSGLFFAWTLVSLATAVTAFVIGLPWHLVGVAVAFAISTTILFPIYVTITARVLGLPAWAYFRNLFGVAQATTGMLAAIVVAQWGLSSAGLAPALRLCLVIAIGGLTYVPLCAWRAPEVSVEVRRVLRVFTRKPAAGPEAA